jgi:hypothetical protein
VPVACLATLPPPSASQAAAVAGSAHHDSDIATLQAAAGTQWPAVPARFGTDDSTRKLSSLLSALELETELEFGPFPGLPAAAAAPLKLPSVARSKGEVMPLKPSQSKAGAGAALATDTLVPKKCAIPGCLFVPLPSKEYCKMHDSSPSSAYPPAAGDKAAAQRSAGFQSHAASHSKIFRPVPVPSKPTEQGSG